MEKAISYLRTSSATNVEGDSVVRQSLAVEAYAARNGFDVVVCYWDQAVSGADAIEDRAGFASLLNFAEAEGVRVVIVEGADRFARSMIANELGVLALRARGIRLLTASGQELTDDSDPSRVMLRQVAAAFAEYEKSRLVQKLRGARDRKSTLLGKRCEGVKGYAATQPSLVMRAVSLRAGGAGLVAIGETLAREGFVTATGKAFGPGQIARLVGTKFNGVKPHTILVECLAVSP